jgi:hypothetical protein
MNRVAKGSLVLFFFTVAAFGQMHGFRASAVGRPFGGFGGFPTNIPASVTSFRPGFSSFGGPVFFHSGRFIPGKGFRFVDPLNRRHFGFFPVGFATGAYVVPDESQMRDVLQQQLQELMRDAPAPTPGEPQKVEITIVDSRDGRNKSEPRDAEPAVKAEPKSPPPPEPELSPTIVVLQDGTRKELRNYAIMGKDLFDLADGKMFRIPLETVNVDATIAANAAVGKLFRLP